MDTTLAIMEAWSAADNVYAAKDGVDAVKMSFQDDRRTLLHDKFDFSGLSFMNSKTGAFIKVKSGFSVIVPGKEIGNKNEVLIAIRGTDLKSDWLTDANFSTHVSSTGRIVHAGFDRVFKELEPHFKSYFAKNNPTTVHCVGHSLGGAIAGMTADWITHKGIGKAKLYTFGSPRVGFQDFATRLTQRVKSENMYRVHHDNDFVSLVPLWPFVHTPQPGTSCCIQNHGFGTFGAHKMSNYFTSLELSEDSIDAWDALRLIPEPPTSKNEIETWLALTPLSIINAYSLKMIGKAIEYILYAAGIGGQLVLMSGISYFDKLSYALEYAWKASKEVASWVEYLIRKILKLTGQAVTAVTNITVEFIRWVFRQLMLVVRRLVDLALLGSKT